MPLIFLIDTMPTGLMLPVIQLARRGITKVFECSSATDPVITRNGKVLPIYLKSDSNIYKFKIKSPSGKDQGIYGCYGTHQNGHAFTAESTLWVGGNSRCSYIQGRVN